MQKIIIGIAGEIASGKGVITEYLTEKYQAKKYRMSDVLKDILIRLHLDLTRENLADLSLNLRKSYGQDILISTLIQDIQKAKNNFVIVDGIRRMAEVKKLRELENFKLFYIEADLETRYFRLKKRDEKQDDKLKTLEDFKKDNELESEKTILELKNLADFVIDNSGDLEKTFKQVDEILVRV